MARFGKFRACKANFVPHTRWMRSQSDTTAHQVPPVWRALEYPVGLTAVPVGGGRARAGLEIDTSEPQARVWRSRGRAAAHRHTQRPGPTKQPGPAGGTNQNLRN